MKKQHHATLISAAAGLLILILDGQTAIEGVRCGIDLCIRTLIPSLFPFFVLSALLTGSLTGHPIKLLKPIATLCHIPEGSESLLATGFLGGYPVGAQSIGQAYRSGQLSRSDAERMLAFCNNAGPSFLFGIVGSMFSDRRIPWLLWGIHIASALIIGAIIPGQPPVKTASVRPGSVTTTSALERSIKAMATVCGWVVLFRMLLQFLEQWVLWLLPASLKILICGFLELSNGCVQLNQISNEGTRFLIAGVMLAFGGACVTMQTASAVPELSLRYYVPGKLLQCCISFLMCILLQILFPPEQRIHMPAAALSSILILTCLLAAYLRREKKISSIPAASGV